MAQRGQQKDLIARFADLGEEALQKLMSTPGTDRFLGAFGKMRDEVDALAKRVRGMEDLEKRLAKLEREVARLKSSTSSARKTSAGKTTSSRKTSASTSRKRSS